VPHARHPVGVAVERHGCAGVAFKLLDASNSFILRPNKSIRKVQRKLQTSYAHSRIFVTANSNKNHAFG
jgi:hypothetical protein